MTAPRLAIVTLAAAAALLLVPSGSWAQDPDSDGDGFSDVQEQVGISLSSGLTSTDAAGTVTSFVPSCGTTGTDPQFCVDPTRPDLFAILVPANPSGLPDDPLSFTSAPSEEGGLGVSVHVLQAVDPTGSRQVSPDSSQNAVRITESLAEPGDKLGLANYGSPNGLDGATIWTARIETFVAEQCGPTGLLCQTDRGVVGLAGVTEELTRWVLNHEVGHLFALTAQYQKRFGGYHVKAGEDEVLTQFVDYDTSRKTGITTFFIPTTYSDRSRADKLLR